MSYYLCNYNGGQLLPLAGPMRSNDVVEIILSKGDIESQKPYCNASRYELGRLGLYPRNKDGDTKLLTDLAINSLSENEGETVCESCGSKNLNHTPGVTGHSTYLGEQDAPGYYYCKDCKHYFND